MGGTLVIGRPPFQWQKEQGGASGTVQPRRDDLGKFFVLLILRKNILLVFMRYTILLEAVQYEGIL